MARQRWRLLVNGTYHNVTADGDMPLLYLLQNELGLKGPRFGCGLAQCGSCSVLLDDREIRACVTPVKAFGSHAVTTLEGLPGTDGAANSHPLHNCIRCSRPWWTNRRRNVATA